MTTLTGCTQTLLSSDYIFFFHQRNRVFDCLLFGQAALVFSEFIFNRMRKKEKNYSSNLTQISQNFTIFRKYPIIFIDSTRFREIPKKIGTKIDEF